jgi:hypothetical protein
MVHGVMAGACARMTATALTHPLDTVRLRLALPGHPYKGGCCMLLLVRLLRIRYEFEERVQA